MIRSIFFFQAEDGIRDLVRSRGLGDVYKRQPPGGVRAVVQVAVPADDRAVHPADDHHLDHHLLLSLIHI